MSEPTLRDATWGDSTAIADIYNESVRAGDCILDSRKITAAELKNKLRDYDDRECFLVLVDDEYVLGWGSIERYHERHGYRFACQTAVMLRRVLTGRGYGPRIKRALIARCREYGYHYLFAKIIATNQRSIDYNLKLGYELVGVQREIGHLHGEWHDVALLQLILPDVQPPS